MRRPPPQGWAPLRVTVDARSAECRHLVARNRLGENVAFAVLADAGLEATLEFLGEAIGNGRRNHLETGFGIAGLTASRTHRSRALDEARQAG